MSWYFRPARVVEAAMEFAWAESLAGMPRERLGPALTALTFCPRTSVLLQALGLKGIGPAGAARVVDLLQQETPGAIRIFQALFPDNRDYTLRELVAGRFHREVRVRFRRDELVTGLYDRKLSPQLRDLVIGASLVFADLHRGDLITAQRLGAPPPGFPISIPLQVIHVDPEGNFSVGKRIAPETWYAAIGLFGRFQRERGASTETRPLGTTVVFEDGVNRREVTLIEDAMGLDVVSTHSQEGNEFAVATRTTWHHRRGGRLQHGIAAGALSSTPHVATVSQSWRIEDYERLSGRQLDPDLEQFFFTPGGVRMVRLGREVDLRHALPLLSGRGSPATTDFLLGPETIPVFEERILGRNMIAKQLRELLGRRPVGKPS